ncbi:methylase-like protein, putative [Theileria annulata]|uniref:Methylase-like protein, putative n=1 Tax=Theileria annulata TaxID=5874 RepID=Q4U9B2_THEAN|nr:methylase-like protein, putative [Theileria annulata]CAI76591.1 methylase-like protein, putative [Theileria annulata]|eukprot:XP_953216.1 methylase-like protein, putative [Theileria annulata]
MISTLAKSKSKYLGRLCCGFIAFPFLYEYTKEFYWTQRLKKLNMDEIISDRFTWLHHCMIVCQLLINYSFVYSEDYKNNVYIPSEDTFFFVDVISKDFKNILKSKPILILEIGSGSGYISTYILNLFKYNNAQEHNIPLCISTDINKIGTLSTSMMIKSNKLESFSECVCMDLFNNLRPVEFDFIFFNPPYVVGTDDDTSDMIDKAWNGGINGSETIIRFINSVDKYISSGGFVYLLVEKRNKINEILELIKENEFHYKIIGTRKVIGEELSIIKFYKSTIS